MPDNFKTQPPRKPLWRQHSEENNSKGICLEDVAHTSNAKRDQQEVDDHQVNQSSSLLASSNAENGAYFNPLKRSQILTKGDKLPNFAQTMPNTQNVFKASSTLKDTNMKSASLKPPHVVRSGSLQQAITEKKPEALVVEQTLSNEDHFKNRD